MLKKLRRPSKPNEEKKAAKASAKNTRSRSPAEADVAGKRRQSDYEPGTEINQYSRGSIYEGIL